MDPALTTERGPYVVVRETHAAVVLLVGDRAYKMKKAVNLGFLDFSTRAARREVCRREVLLNRRLAPDVYLGTADVIGPEEGPGEPLVVMRRMPDDRRLATVVREGRPADRELRQLAHVLAAFHARADRSPQITAEGARDALRSRWAASFDAVRPFHGKVLDTLDAAEVERLTLRYLSGREPLFAARMRDGCVVDGHGDLLAEDVFCLPDGPRVLDCLEFDDRLRYLDQLDDAAFLAMDLEHLGAPDLAARFLGWYVELSADPAPPSLLHHYLAYRAFVRAKVACLRHDQGDPGAATEAGALTTIARRHLATAAVSLVLVGGLPGTGKSTLAGLLADRLGCTLLSSDRVRKELAGLAPDEPARARYREGIYTPAWTARTYTELLSRARRLLALGESVVIDASWTDQAQRDAAAGIATGTDSDLVSLRCDAPATVVAARLRDRRRDRQRDRHGPSDADAAVAAAMGADADPWPAATVVDTSGPRDVVAQQAAAVVRPFPAGTPWARRRPVLMPD